MVDSINCFKQVIMNTYEIHLLCGGTTEERCEVVVNNDKVHLVRFLGSGHRGFVSHLKMDPLRVDSMLIPQEVFWKNTSCSPTVDLHFDRSFVYLHFTENKLVSRSY